MRHCVLPALFWAPFLTLFLTLIPAAVAAESAAEITQTEHLEAFVDGVVESGLKDHNIAGAVVAIVKDDRVLLAKGYGFADVANEIPVDPATTLFRIGSVTKLFTWTALMQLKEQDRLGFDADVNDYLSSVRIPATFAEAVTLNHLMSHSGGFEDRIIGLFSEDPTSMRPYSQLLSTDLPTRVRPPGQVSSYSNHGVGVAGLVVEDVSGMPWPEYTRVNILEPLGMVNATAEQPPPAALAANMSMGYQRAGGRFKEKPFEFVPLGAVGGISASAVAMTRFAMAHLNDGAYPGGRILSAAGARQLREVLFQPHPELKGWLHGFADYSRADHFGYGHDGGTFWFATQFVLFPEAGLGIFISTNTAGGGRVNGALLSGLMDRYFPDAEPDLVAKAPSSDLRHLAGSYVTFRHPVTTLGKLLRLMAPISVSPAADGQLMITGLGSEPSYWQEIAPGVFQNPDSRGKLKFVTNAGQQQLFIGSAGGSFYKLTGTHSPTFQFTVEGISLMLLGWALLAWPVQRFRRHGRLPVTEARCRLVAWLISLSLFVVLLGVLANASQDIVYGIPTVLTVLLWVPVLTLIMLAGYGYLVFGLVRDTAIGVSTRVFHVALFAAATVICWLFSYWNLIASG